jgi:hypothetical protein
VKLNIFKGYIFESYCVAVKSRANLLLQFENFILACNIYLQAAAVTKKE